MAYKMSDGFWTPDDDESQFSLSQSQKDENANRIYTFFTKIGWQKESICAMLGNMDVECRMNPRARSISADTYGLTQWHPASKYINWAIAEGLDYELGTSQCKRIKYEEANELQWQDWASVTFEEWARTSQDPIETLTYDFMRYYEVANAATLQERIDWALYYFDNVKLLANIPLLLIPMVIKKRKQIGRRKIAL
jgi:hypothetical protein